MNPYRVVYTTKDGFTNEMTRQGRSPELVLNAVKRELRVDWKSIEVELIEYK